MEIVSTKRWCYQHSHNAMIGDWDYSVKLIYRTFISSSTECPRNSKLLNCETLIDIPYLHHSVHTKVASYIRKIADLSII